MYENTKPAHESVRIQLKAERPKAEKSPRWILCRRQRISLRWGLFTLTHWHYSTSRQYSKIILKPSKVLILCLPIPQNSTAVAIQFLCLHRSKSSTVVGENSTNALATLSICLISGMYWHVFAWYNYHQKDTSETGRLWLQKPGPEKTGCILKWSI